MRDCKAAGFERFSVGFSRLTEQKRTIKTTKKGGIDLNLGVSMALYDIKLYG